MVKVIAQHIIYHKLFMYYNFKIIQYSFYKYHKKTHFKICSHFEISKNILFKITIEVYFKFFISKIFNRKYFYKRFSIKLKELFLI